MSTTAQANVLVVTDPGRQDERIAMAGFLAGYCGCTRASYATDPRLFATWCHEGHLTLFTVQRAHIELFGRWMEENSWMRSTVARRFSTLASFYRYCEQEQLVQRNPALHLRRPRVDYESRTLGLDRNGLGAYPRRLQEAMIWPGTPSQRPPPLARRIFPPRHNRQVCRSNERRGSCTSKTLFAVQREVVDRGCALRRRRLGLATAAGSGPEAVEHHRQQPLALVGGQSAVHAHRRHQLHQVGAVDVGPGPPGFLGPG